MPGATPPGWLLPDWPAPPGVRALFTTRGDGPDDGASAPPFEHFNLGEHVGDAPAAVAANRARLATVLGARPVFLQQVHGCEVLPLRHGVPDGHQADAAVTGARGLACTVMVADCLPVLITDTEGRAVAAAHAGWRGLAAGVLDRTLQFFRAEAGVGFDSSAIKNEAIECLAWLGPCIGPQVFEVGPEVRAAFVEADAGAADCFVGQPSGKYLADLPALARRRLAAAGVTRVYGNDGSAAWCTVQQPGRYYSYRRDQLRRGASGRMAACVWLS